MAGQRTIKITWGLENPPRDGATEHAVGYLANWSLTRFPHVDISVADDLEILAAYRMEEGGPVGFVIGAIREEGGKYSFHS